LAILSFFLLLFVWPALSAQDDPAPVRVAGETIVVTADRIAEPIEEATDSVSIITAEDLQRSQAVTVAEALRDIAGMNIVRSGSPGHATSAFLRGASSSQLLVLVDGVEINDPFFGGTDIGSLVTSGVERIEIVRGAQSPLYGSQAMAGVVNVVTASRATVTDGVDGTLRAETGSMSMHTESLQLTGRSDALQWKAGGSFLSTAGQFDNDEFRNLQLDGRMQGSLSAGCNPELDEAATRRASRPMTSHALPALYSSSGVCHEHDIGKICILAEFRKLLIQRDLDVRDTFPT